MQLLPMGPTAVLVESPDPNPMTWGLALRRAAPPGVVEVVPAAATVLVRCASAHALHEAIETFGDLDVEDIGDDSPAAEVVIPVRYDGPDLDTVAGRIGRSIAEVIEMHSGSHYEVAFCGFAPGFAYLRGLAPDLHLPRRTTPRTRVPVGSVAIAAEYSAVYPTASPGGWHLLGTTERKLFDVALEPPALLQPGTRVRFASS